MKKRNVGILAGIFVVVVIVIFGGIYLTRNLGKSSEEVAQETAQSQLDQLIRHISPTEGTPVKSAVEYTEEEDGAEELPDIDTCEVSVEPTTSLYAEIYASPEKAGTGTDGWMTQMAEEFNASGYEVNGEKVSVKLRNVSSGQAIDYIATGAAVPDGVSPSSDLWTAMLSADGVETETISQRLVGNVAGIVLSNEKYEELKEEYGTIDLTTIVDATAAGGFAMGYTNPFASTTGMNFLVSTLLRYDSENPLSGEAVAGFTSFQTNVPFVSLTTLQMRTAAEKGTLDGFVMEYQTYCNDTILSSGYTFTAFGFRHDNPLVAVASAPEEKKEILRLFAQYCEENGSELAEEYGFNQMENYSCEYEVPSGETLRQAQQLYKTNKDTGHTVVAVFVTDVSGSMSGEPINSLKESLVNAMQYISSGNSIGLVSYSTGVKIELPIASFDMEQQAYFKGTVESLTPNGNTATYNGLCVALGMIEEYLETDPDAVPMIFLLSDGATNAGYSHSEVSDLFSSLEVPIYTIAYGEDADTDALQMIADINEAAALNASTQDIVYQIKQLFNATM